MPSLDDRELGRFELRSHQVNDLVRYMLDHTNNRGEAASLLLAAYVTICESFEPRIERQEAAERAKAGVLSMSWRPEHFQ